MEYAVTLENVEKSYQMGEVTIHALSGLNMKVSQGEVLAAMGPSGSGKTTLLNIVGALDLPSSGKVEVAGSNLSELSDKELTLFRRHHIGFIFQSFNLIPVLTAQENVELPMLFTKKKKTYRLERSLKLLEDVGLGDRAAHTPDQ